MAIFAVIPQPNANSSKLPERIEHDFKDAHISLGGEHGWLLSFDGTAQELSEKIGIKSGETGAAIVVEIASYFGRADPNIWTWMKTNMEKGKDA